ncbi:MAG: pyrroline-5-carboxylate reductase [Sedimentisphaerales bacterium]|nr:pyrroline-5-carboxylate reductase [Sedimentisphaerales bacterium]
MNKVGFIGAGKMAQALMGAMIRSGLIGAKDIICSDVSGEQLEKVERELGVVTTGDNAEVFQTAEMVVLAFKPQNFPDAISGCVSEAQADQVVVSIMAGVRIEKIREVLAEPVVRVMPNTACLVGQMAAGFAVGADVSDEQLARVRAMLACAGTAVQVEEDLLDAVTGLSGSGPAFVARIIEAFINGGVRAGLEPGVARELTLKTFAGTAELLSEWKMDCEELIQMVSSPNGTTVAGREVLENSPVAEIIENTVLRATQRSRELGK